MQYRYVTEKQNYEDYSAGRVILSTGGMTSFPVRLANEIFQRCANYFPENQRLRVYDPCCGGGYLLTVLGFLHHDRIASLFGSDIDSDRVTLANDNLRLLTAEGLAARRETLQNLVNTYDKLSHKEALESLDRLKQLLPKQPITHKTWTADALQSSAESQPVDLIICDVPYGNVTDWQSTDTDSPITTMLDAQYDTLAEGGIAAIISDKSQRGTHNRYTRLQHETIGKRRFILMQKA